MSVKIEILDYVLGDSESIVDLNLGTPQTGWSFISNKSASFTGDGANTKFYNDISIDIISGRTYKLRFQVLNYTGTGDIGFAQGSSSFVGLGIPITARIASNGTINVTFTATASGKAKLLSRGTVTTATIYNISLIDTNGIDWDNSIVGELDVTDHTDFPLALTFQISDFKDLTSTTGDYSKSFRIPATKNNNNIFKHLYIPNLIVDNKVTDKKSCRILFDGLYSLFGLLQVDGVGGYGEKPSYYNCVFFGSNLSWANTLENTFMNDIEWGATGDNLTYNKNSITATWQHENCDNASKSPIVYPVTSYGVYNVDGVERTIQLLDTLGENNVNLDPLVYKGYTGFYDDGNSYETPQPVADWRPAVFVKTTLDKIFSQIGSSKGLGNGYIINSSFMNTSMFKELVWLLPNFKYNDPDSRTNLYSIRSNFENGVTMTASGAGSSITDSGVQKQNEGSINQDQGNLFYTGAGAEVLELDSSNLTVTLNDSYVDFTNNEVNIGEFGNYLININGLKSKVALAFKGGSTQVEIDSIDTIVSLELKTVGQNSWNRVDSGSNSHIINQDVNQSYAASSTYVNIPSISYTSFLNKGDKLRLRIGMRVFCSQRNWQNFLITTFFKSNSNSIFNLELNPFNVEYGQTYNLKDVISSEYSQTDFIKGVAHAFNLQMTTDESTRTVNIEPFDSFYRPYSEAIDWTQKLNRSNIINDKWLESDLKRDIVFKYKSDSDDKKVESRSSFFDGIKDEYPYYETLPPTFKKGKSAFENPFFAGTFNGKDQDTVEYAPVDTAFSACLWTENVSPSDEGRPNKGNNFLPRLLYWNKYSPATSIGDKKAIVQTWSSVTQTITADASDTGVLSNIYPQATMLNRESNTSPNLAYGNAWIRNYDDSDGSLAAAETGSGLYETYYRNMIEGLIKSPRLRTVSITLNISDIVNLDFKKLIYIDGVYWRINKIIDYQPNKNESTKVQLLEWFAVGIFAASAPSVGNSGLFVWNEDGSILDDSNYNMGL